MIGISIGRICSLMEMIGLKVCDTKSNTMSVRVHTVIVFVHTSLAGILCLYHAFSTFTRSTRYLPEFCQMLLEDVISWMAYLCLLHFQANAPLLHLLKHAETHTFTRENPVLIRRFRTKATVVFACVLCAVAGGIASGVLEALLPITSSELAIRQHVYRTSHPERRHPWNLRFPFVDELRSGTYESIFVWIVYVNTLFVFATTVVISSLPVSIILLQAQYTILAQYVKKIGKQHMDKAGNRILYTNIRKCKYVTEDFVLESKYKRNQAMFKWKELRQYERSYLKQVFRFHQKLIEFQEKLRQISSPMFIVVIANNIMFSLCLYQLVLHPSKLSPIRFTKFISEFTGIILQYYLVCNCSEMADSCSGLLLSALHQSEWVRCTNQTKRDLCFFVRRLQRPNHLKYFNGAIALSRAYFLRVANVSYTFVNFMRLKSATG